MTNEIFYGIPNGYKQELGKHVFNQPIVLKNRTEHLRLHYGTLSNGTTAYSTFTQTNGDLNIVVVGGGGISCTAGQFSVSNIVTGNLVATGGFSLNGTPENSPFATSLSNVGGSSTTNTRLTFLGATTAVYKAFISGNQAPNMVANAVYGAMIFANITPAATIGVPIATTGTHPMFAQLVIKKLSIIPTTGTGVLTASAGIYVEDVATEALENYALFIDNGVTRLDGNTCIGTNALPGSTAFLFLGASTTAKAAINFAAGVDPTGGGLVDGSFWFDGTNFKCCVAGTTKTFTIV